MTEFLSLMTAVLILSFSVAVAVSTEPVRRWVVAQLTRHELLGSSILMTGLLFALMLLLAPWQFAMLSLTPANVVGEYWVVDSPITVNAARSGQSVSDAQRGWQECLAFYASQDYKRPYDQLNAVEQGILHGKCRNQGGVVNEFTARHARVARGVVDLSDVQDVLAGHFAEDVFSLPTSPDDDVFELDDEDPRVRTFLFEWKVTTAVLLSLFVFLGVEWFGSHDFFTWQ